MMFNNNNKNPLVSLGGLGVTNRRCIITNMQGKGLWGICGELQDLKPSKSKTQNKGKLFSKIEEITVGKAHGNLIKILQQSQPSFSIRRE